MTDRFSFLVYLAITIDVKLLISWSGRLRYYYGTNIKSLWRNNKIYVSVRCRLIKHTDTDIEIHIYRCWNSENMCTYIGCHLQNECEINTCTDFIDMHVHQQCFNWIGSTWLNREWLMQHLEDESLRLPIQIDLSNSTE